MSGTLTNDEDYPQIIMRYIIEHVFLPARLPGEEDPDVVKQDSALLCEVAKVAALFKDTLHQNRNLSHKTRDAWDIISRMFDAMLAIRITNRLDKSIIEAQLQSMAVGDVVPIYVTHQNAGIIFRKRSDDELSFESFEISLPNEEVTTTIGKILVTYPANDRLLIPAIPELFSPLANTIAFLGSQTMSEAAPTFIKAGSEHENIRDTASPRWITEAVAGYLRALGRVEIREEGTYAIQKRIDDHALLGPGKTLPWRRSAMWLLIRVALQSTLGELGVEGGEGYKAFQVYFMAHLLECCIDSTDAIVPDDVVQGMNQKVARRMQKMKEWVDVEENPFPALRFVEEVINNVSEVLACHWKEDREKCVQSAPWVPPTQQEIEESMELSLKINQEYLQSVVKRTEKLADATNDYDDENLTHSLITACSKRLYVDSREIPATINTKELDIGLMDFEAWVEKRLPTWSKDVCRSEADFKALSSITNAYSRHGLKHYAESPERMSIFWLTLMELWITLDKLVVDWSPLMRIFSPEIPADLLDPLLLPNMSHLKRLDTVQSYITRRHSESTGKTLFGDIESPQSFHNLYFEQSSEMQEEKVAIEKWTIEETERTLQKMRDANSEYYDWKTEHSRTSCTYTRRQTWYGGYEQNHNEWACRRCELARLMNGARTPKFEKPLPTSEYAANPIVFELNCPSTFGLWREATHQLLLNAFSHSQGASENLYKLESYAPTNRFHHAQERSMSIGSSTAPIVNSVLESQHTLPANPKDVIVSHSGRYRLSYEGSWLAQRSGCLLRGLCTLRLDGPYTPLSLFIKDTSHTSNDVIASQVDCPNSISLDEYIGFGHLRAGNKIQLRNIMRVLISDSLSLNADAVHSLTMQATWQAGPNLQTEAWYRDAHEDLLDKKFATEMLSVLNDSMGKLGGSGREVFHLATLITLATRLLSLSENADVKGGCLAFLAAARRTASAWMALVRNEALEDTIDDPAKWQHRMALVAIVWRLAFEVGDDALLEQFCDSPDNLADLLFTKMTIAADSSQYISLSNATKLLLRRENRLSYRLEPYISSKLETSRGPLDESTRMMLDKHRRGPDWNPLASDGSRWWKRVARDCFDSISGSICMNILNGNLLVDGKSVNRLPDSYIAHGTYQKLFGKSVSLWCYPSSMLGMQYEASYRVNQDSPALQLFFAMAGAALVVRVLREEGIEEYIPRDQIQGDVPSVLLQYHHWYCEALNVIEFRPLESPWDHDDRNWILQLKRDFGSALAGNLQKSVSQGLKRAMDPHSSVFGRIHDSIRALEPTALHMMAIVPPAIVQTSLLDVTLTHHKMDFFLNRDSRLECRSHPGYLLDFNQDIGCLYGLANYLVLCDGSASEQVRKVIVPRGRLEAVETLRHPIIRVRVNGTGCHTYDVDELVGRLCGSGNMESSLFLVELHAFTASHQPDPLTMRTGTEEALQRLEGASLVSHHEASKSWREHMKRIATISPRREYYPPGMRLMERTEWNNNIPTSSQHPGFEQRIARILSYWNDTYLEKLLLEHTKPLESSSGVMDLGLRATIRDLRPTASLHALSEHRLGDKKHFNRDALRHQESQTREALAYQVTDCAAHLTAGLPICSDLRSLAKKWSRVQKTQAWGWLDLPQWLSGDVSDIWCTLYELCRNAPQKPGPLQYKLAMTFTMLAYKHSVPLDILGMLMAIVRDAQFRETKFQHPVGENLEMHLGFGFDQAEIRNSLKREEIGFEKSTDSYLTVSGSTSEEIQGLREQIYRNALCAEVDRAVRELEEWWKDIPNRHSTIVVSVAPRIPNLASHINLTVRPLLDRWIRNGAFLDHLQVVSDGIPRLDHNNNQALYLPQTQSVRRNLHSISIKAVTLEVLMKERHVKPRDVCGPVVTLPDFAEQQPASAHESRITKLRIFEGGLDILLRRKIERRYLADFSESVTALEAESPALEAQIPSVETLFAFRDSQKKYLTLMQRKIIQFLSPASRSEKLLGVCGLWPTVTALTLLQGLSLKHRNRTPPAWITAISHFANQVIAVQQSRRLFHYGILDKVLEYNREILQSRKREPLGDPDWLLVEIDGNLCIRSDQAELASSMLAPTEGRNTVHQLNMGEGKSSVIVPIVSATAANGQQQVRVVVLKPQSKLQLNILLARLSGLANRRIICLPFSRDLQLDPTTPGKILQILHACRSDGAIWLCQPEHLLSFKLLGLDLSMRTPGNSKIGQELIECQRWMQEHTRDILDESDEILHTRHQLVYTVGDQRPFDAEATRWEVVEEVLSLLQSQLNATPSSHFEVDPPKYSGQFPTVRMMSDEGNTLFHQLAADIIFNDVLTSVRTASLPTQLKGAALRLLRNYQVTDEDLDILSLQLYCKEKHEDVLWKSLLLVRGLIAFKILPLALQKKRFRVDYGLAPLQEKSCGTDYSQDTRRTHLAVPYRAKDSPSLRSNFAHPDVLILLTCLTYYYGGLNGSMIIQTFKELLKSDSPELIYEQWTKELPIQFRRLSSVNLDNEEATLRSLHPSMGYNKHTIDFFLNRCIFPKEAKEFPFKMSTSGWDLAMRKTNPTTGFSGTNDSRFLLPTSIFQDDLPPYRHTNALVVGHLLRDENSLVIPHRNNLTSNEILGLLTSNEISNLVPPNRCTVFLDVGAQILDCSNKEFVELWLSKIGDSIKAAVFFDDDDNLVIRERDGTVQSFADSPYSTRLDECVVYLDDPHTRGTDLKLPTGCQAAVTLGPRLSKDKLVQGCMRMRKLGSGLHSLVFLAPDEVLSDVKNVIEDPNVTVEASHVVPWAMKNTCRQLEESVANWVIQGYEFAERERAWKEIFEAPKNGEEMKKLFCQEEGRDLSQLYGIHNRMDEEQTTDENSPIRREIQQHCKLFDDFSLDDARAQEEQEVELVQELQVEREVERPPAAEAALHILRQEVREFVRTGLLPQSSSAFVSIEDSIAETSLVFPAGGSSVFRNLIVTKDFQHTIKRTPASSKGSTDNFLRSVGWVVTSQVQPRFLVALSPFEANALLPDFRESSKVRLRFYAARTSLTMQPLEDLTIFALPTTLPTRPIRASLSQQLNLYSGTLYLRDNQSYQDLCATLRLHFGKVPPQISDMAIELSDGFVKNSNGFVEDVDIRAGLDLNDEEGFEEDPVEFLRKLFHFRRHGRGFGPSHMGQILFGTGLDESTKWR